MSLAIAVCLSLPAFGKRPNASLPTDWPGGMRFRMLRFGLCSAVCAQSGLRVPRCCALLCCASLRRAVRCPLRRNGLPCRVPRCCASLCRAPRLCALPRRRCAPLMPCFARPCPALLCAWRRPCSFSYMTGAGGLRYSFRNTYRLPFFLFLPVQA